MKIKDGFVLRTICGNTVVVGEGLSQVNFSKIVSLNPTAAYLWESVVGKDFTVEDMTALLLDEYDVTPEVASKDAASLAKSWTEAGLVEP